jgi:hypothetical protein
MLWESLVQSEHRSPALVPSSMVPAQADLKTWSPSSVTLMAVSSQSFTGDALLAATCTPSGLTQGPSVESLSMALVPLVESHAT